MREVVASRDGANDDCAVSENRKSPRVAAPHVLVKVSTRERLKSSYLKDLSEGGLFVRADKPLPVGRPVVIDLLPPGWATPLRLSGTVSRSLTEGPAPGMAVKFDENGSTEFERLRELIAEYQDNAAAPAAPNDQQQQLAQLFERYAELQTALDQRDTELRAERARREEAATRALELANQLEAARTNGATTPTESPTSRQLSAELGVAQREVSELRTRVASLEGELSAYKVELAQLEADDATSRRLAQSLAKEKADFVTQLTRVSKEAQELAMKLEEASRLRADHERLAAALISSEQAAEQVEDQLAAAQARIKELELDRAQVEQERQQREHDRRQAAELLDGANGTIASLRGDLAASERRMAHHDLALKEATTRVEKLKHTERELRDLLAAVSGRGDDVVVIDAGPAPSPPSPSLPAASDSTVLSVTTAIEAAEPETPRVSSSSIQVVVDVDGPSSRNALEIRLRANEALLKSDVFDARAGSGDVVDAVKGLLDSGARFSDLVVLGRGKVAPPDLVSTLVDMLETGAIRFQQTS